MPLSALFRRKPQPSPAVSARVPAGQRVYAIGDVHGCADELERLLGAIRRDHAARGPARLTVILLGDLINRGPDPARVIEMARELVASGDGRLVKGNHEEIFVLAGRGDHRAARTLMNAGGTSTLASYGLTDQEIAAGNYHELATLLKSRIPNDVLGFLEQAEDRVHIGDYLFVHAGIRPGVPLAQQASADMRWIRHEFLQSRSQHGAMVVHGHSIVANVEECDNRIGIDTGAYRSGVLTAIGLEGGERWYLSTGGDC